jgi:SAM-dependent methyltransferase/peptidoglycan/xylan/chitin deacetylase (PgdA/CDA1 family)
MAGIPILTYHSLNIAGNDYLGNDHVALRADLRMLGALGWRIVPLTILVDHLLDRSRPWPEKCVAITFDDGTNFDVEDLEHPTAGLQRSMLNILRDYRSESAGQQPDLHATSFVIASAEARTVMDRACVLGRDWMSDRWWAEAVSSGLFHVGNHSWDHCHDSLPVVAQREQRKGTFAGVDNFADAQVQVRRAAEAIKRIAPNPAADLFAYPYGTASDYLRCEYLPEQAVSASPVVRAAFSTEPELLHPATERWWIPRFVCGHHWKSPAELEFILRDAASNRKIFVMPTSNSAAPEFARLSELLRTNPADLAAHNALEHMNAPQAFSRWMQVNCVIDPRDDIFHFFANHELAKNPIREYLSDGWRTLSELMQILEAVDRPLLKTASMLEFAAGFGRFTRHLVKVLPGRVTCADVMPGSVAFLREQFGVGAIDSAHAPDQVAFPAQYDLVFVLSMFTHLPTHMWTPWLKALCRAVKPGGLLVFSVHNEAVAMDIGVTFDSAGTHFIASSESPSIDAQTYGTTFTTRQFVIDRVREACDADVLHYQSQGFWFGQDGVVVRVD